MNEEDFKNKIKSIQGKTIAIVYIYEGDIAAGYHHYEAWKSDVISSWMFAVEEIHCMPLIMDLRTFVQKAMNNTLPNIDFVINLNNGTINISTLGVVPSICSYLDIPCVPSSTLTTVCGEHKRISNIIASSIGLNVPKTLSSTTRGGIIRPINLGSSLGIKRLYNEDFNNTEESIYQEFIKGCDITTPILYNPLTEKLEVLPAILYCPNKFDSDWFLGEKQKKEHSGYKKHLYKLATDATKKYLELAKIFGITTYCRIDARLMCYSRENLIDITTNGISSEYLYFLEINPMPTIKSDINFHTSLDGLTDEYPIYTSYNLYKQLVENVSYTGFILACSISQYL